MATKRNASECGDTRARKPADTIRKVGVFPNRPTEYTGDLAQPLRAAVPGGPGLGASLEEQHAYMASQQSARMAEIRRRMDLLFAHYCLERHDFVGLAVALAFAHVPGFQDEPRKPRRGRPTKQAKALAAASSKAASTGQNALMLIAEALYPAKGKGKSGRPVRWDAELQRTLVRVADDWKQSQKALGRRGSDAAWVRAECDGLALKTGERKGDVFKREGRALASALSRARQAVSKPEINSTEIIASFSRRLSA